MTPGGLKPFEHQWSMVEALTCHDEVCGRTAARERIHALAIRLKEGSGRWSG